MNADRNRQAWLIYCNRAFYSEAEDSKNGEGVVGAAEEIWPPAERNQVFEQFEI